ncbi:hypothetical protein N7532_003878 [Penicillium argentinense]|uniref:Uncharacterized protein n=1 Tax=Penicillium argentinense TaxID=1131581 RepID=A0A9W9KEE0_9EURO|nr:uncharacterized protein N7532_003878 [Penicillium argentinense]KAJ5103349.1 hypothetical protein N7532_003878 [Penicillium argentinense]
MPNVGVMGPSVDSTGRPLFRSHKALPRRGIEVPSDNPVEVAQPASPDQNGTVAPAPPLTPPDAIQDGPMDDRDRTPRKTDSSTAENQSTGMLTPRRPSKPPTPDVTPPRTTSTSKRPTLNQFGNYLSSSSRAESFQTACESISSEGDMDTPGRSSRSRSVSQRARRRIPSSSTSRQNFTNGVRTTLAYTRDKDTPPSNSRPLSETEYETGFESFDGEWANQTDGSPTPLPGKRKPSKMSQTLEASKMPDRPSPKASEVNDTLDVLNLNASLRREQTLRDRLKEPHDLATSSSMERFREDIGWPSHEEPDSHRLSGISSTSTVEAVIIDSPKRKQRLLRHTEKRGSLRSASSPITNSGRTSTVSNPDSQQHRLVHKAGRISEQDRRSISSDVSFSMKNSKSEPRASIDVIPVVVVPERRSSLKSGPHSQVSSKPTSQQSSQRPPLTSMGSGTIDVPRQRKRTMSDSVPALSRDTESRGRPMGRPVIPPRSSSLSAPTSRNNSRATSLTSESLRSHTIAMDLEMQKRLEQQPVSPPRQNILAFKGTPPRQPQTKSLLEAPNQPAVMVSSTDDMATLRPPSLPYTQWSIPSSSPGPVEIHEATAVSLFPHNNRSLLLVNQPRAPPETCVLQAFHNPDNHPRTPDMPIQGADDPSQFATGMVHSPLKNPRPPPKPPVSKPLLPIPMQEQGGAAAQEKDGNGRLGSRWSSVRRTWGARPRSDSFNAITRSFSLRSAKNRTAGLEMDSNLHPFWRPRGFWDDIPGSPEKDRSARQSVHDADDALVVNNSLGLPHQRIIFDGPPYLARRSPELKRVLDYNASRGSLVDRGMLRSPVYQHRYRVLGRWSLRLRSMSLRKVRVRLRRLRQRRDERKRAARRETLKQSIGGPVYVASSTTNGVVR